MKKLLLVLLIASLLVCVFVISASAITQAEADKDYYDKVYTTADGKHQLPIYEKVGDTYYPLVWFAYDVLDDDGETVLETKYVKAHFEDVTAYSYEPSQGRFNGLFYEYTDEKGKTFTLDSSNVVLLNMRGGVMSNTQRIDGSYNSTNVTIKTLEWSKSGYPAFSSIEAIYCPLTLTTASAPKTTRVFDIDRHHEVAISMGTQAFMSSQIKEIFVPGSTKFNNGNSQFKMCYSLETIIFGKGFYDNNKAINGYTFEGNPLKRIYWMGTEDEIDNITVAEKNNGPFFELEKISLTGYLALSDEKRANGKYLVYDVTECFLYGHTAGDEADCTKGISCEVCSTVMVEAFEKHDTEIEITYPKGFMAYGVKITDCSRDGCNAIYEKDEKVTPIVSTVGYSYREEGKGGLTCGFEISNDALKAYINANPTASVEFSLLVVNPKYLDEKGAFFKEDGTIDATQGAIQISVGSLKYATLGVKVTGFTVEQMSSIELAFALVAKVDGVVSVYQHTPETAKGVYSDTNGLKLDSVTVETVAPEFVAALKGKEEII